MQDTNFTAELRSEHQQGGHAGLDFAFSECPLCTDDTVCPECGGKMNLAYRVATSGGRRYARLAPSNTGPRLACRDCTEVKIDRADGRDLARRNS